MQPKLGRAHSPAYCAASGRAMSPGFRGPPPPARGKAGGDAVGQGIHLAPADAAFAIAPAPGVRAQSACASPFERHPEIRAVKNPCPTFSSVIFASPRCAAAFPYVNEEDIGGKLR